MLERKRIHTLCFGLYLLLGATICAAVVPNSKNRVCDSSEASLESSVPLFTTENVLMNDIAITIESNKPFTVDICRNGQLVWKFDCDNGTISHHMVVWKQDILQSTELSEKSIYISISKISSDTNIHLDVIFNNKYRIYPPIVKPRSEEISRLRKYTYHVITVCDVLGFCQVAISSIHKEELNIGITTALRPSSCSLQIGERLTRNGDSLILTLTRYKAIQLQSECDLTGTVIESPTQLSVFSGGIQTVIGEGGKSQTFMGSTLPVSHAGKRYVVVSSQFTWFGDFIKILTTEVNTTLDIHGQKIKMENRSMTISKRIDIGEVLHVMADKTILISQLSLNYLLEPVLNSVPTFRPFRVRECNGDLIAIFSHLNETDDEKFESGDIFSRIHGTEYLMSFMYQELCKQLDRQMVVLFEENNIQYTNIHDENELMYENKETILVPDENREHKGKRFVLTVFKLGPVKHTYLTLIAVPNNGVNASSQNIDINVYSYLNDGRTPAKEKLRQVNNGVYHNILQIYYPDLTVIVVQADEPIMLRSMMYSTENGMAAAMLIYPIDVLGYKYIVGMFWMEASISICTIVAQANNDTTLDIILPEAEHPIQVEIDGTHYTNAMKISSILKQYTKLSLQSHEDLTGTFIYADKPVAVFCGQIHIQPNDSVYYEDSFVTAEQFSPTETFGKSFDIMQLNFESINCKFCLNSTLKLVASLPHTLVTVTCFTKIKMFKYLEFPGSFIELAFGEITKIDASKEILVLQEIKGDEERSLIVVVPNHQSERRYQFSIFPKFSDTTALNGTEIFVTGNGNDSAFTLYRNGHGKMHSSQLDDRSSYTAIFRKPMAAYIIDSRGMYGSSAGISLQTNEICSYGKEPDIDCDGFIKEDMCILDTYNKDSRNNSVQFISPDAGFYVSIKNEMDVRKRAMPLSMYGFRMSNTRSLQCLVKACDNVRIFLSMLIKVHDIFKILYEIAVNKDEVRIIRHDIGSLEKQELASEVSSNCLSCSKETQFVLSLGNDLRLAVACEEDAPLMVPEINLHAVLDVYMMTDKGSTGQWNCRRPGVASYVGDEGQYLKDFDLDGNLDEDCAFRAPGCGYPDFNLFGMKINLSMVNTSQKSFDVGTKFRIHCSNGYNHSGIDTTTCLPTGFWSREFICSTDVICGTPPRIDGTKEFDVSPSIKYKPGDTFKYECNSGNTMFGSEEIECLDDGHWSDASITCSECTCPCNNRPLTEDAIKDIKDNIRKQNLIDKKSVSKYKRKKISAPDNRFSAKAIGYVGVVFLCSSVLVIIMFDIVPLINTARTMTHNVGTFLGRLF